MYCMEYYLEPQIISVQTFCEMHRCTNELKETQCSVFLSRRKLLEMRTWIHSRRVEVRFVFGDAHPRGHLVQRNLVQFHQLTGEIASVIHLAVCDLRQTKTEDEHGEGFYGRHDRSLLRCLAIHLVYMLAEMNIAMQNDHKNYGEIICLQEWWL